MSADKNKTMRVAVYYRNDDIRLEERPVPVIGPGELLVKVLASGICGSDVLEWYRIKNAPRVLGHEIAGAVSLIIVAEIAAKTAMLSSIYFGKSRGEGLGSIFIKHLNRKAYPLSVVFSLLACFYLAHYAGLFAIGVGLLTSILLVAAAHRGFGCVTGDVMGAVNETTRVIVLLVLVFLR